MENINWLINTLGVMMIIWTLLNLLQLWAMLETYEVKYKSGKIKIHFLFVVPFILSFIYISWLIFM